MKQSIIEEIYFNNVGVDEREECSEEYEKISDEAYNLYKQLMDVLNDEQKKIFIKFADSEIGVCAEGERLQFKEGFKVGVRLAMECLI